MQKLFRFGRGTGVKRVTVPDLSGLTKTEIESLLDTLGLTYSSTGSDTADASLANKNKSQSITSGTTVLRGSSISFEFYNYTAPPYFPPYFPYFPSFVPTPYVALGYTDNGTGITLQWSTAGGPSATSVSFGGSLAGYVSGSVNNGGSGYAYVNSPYGQSGNLNVTIQTAYGSATSNTVDYTNYHAPAPPDFTPAPPDFTPVPPDFTPVPPYFKGGKGPGCIYSNSNVLTANGYTLASKILVGEKLLTLKPTDNTIIDKSIDESFDLVEVEVLSVEHSVKDVIGFNDSSAMYSLIQPVMIDLNGKFSYVAAGDILAGDKIIEFDSKNNVVGSIVVESIQQKTSVDVYDIRTTPYQWYIVDNNLVIT